ncbi:MAG: Fe-S cluster assembly protein SufD [Bacteroidales bacterium]|jgi:Fe-S cluster assembly protein SufD|nr:Fe-S cluster assembly protein SufD [Bacteroidales bacterium]
MDKKRNANTQSLKIMDINKNNDFNCSIPNLHTAKIILHNGVFVGGRAISENVICKNEKDIFVIEIPENKVLSLPLQMVNTLYDGKQTQTKMIIRVGSQSKVQFIHCDDSCDEQSSTSFNTIDILLAANSSFDYYKMENINNDSSITTEVNFNLAQGSKLKTYGFSLNGKQVTNTLNVFLNEPYAEVRLNGLYLMDKQQEVSTYVNVRHNAADCHSNQLFKGILDDSAKARFVGHVFVDYGAKNTEAMQTNKNILLTDKAKINTKPFLEIYNDDVKCSHGATIGQLDEEAMFYLRSRGISFRSARMLLMYAFCQEILLENTIAPLGESISEIIKLRLQGELSACCDCVFQCAQAKNHQK